MTLEIGFFLSIWFLSLILLLSGTYFLLKKLRGVPPYLDMPFGLYPVSILKPLKGIDSDLEENLESFFQIQYPQFEILFSIADPFDPAGKVAENLIQKYPHISARLLIGETPLGENPKVNNIAKSYEEARYDLVLISDSNVRVTSRYLKRLVAHLNSGVGIVTAIVKGKAPQGFTGLLEAIHLNTFYARGMTLAEAFGRPCVVGKSMLMRKSVAKRFGGLRTLSSYLAEDYMAGEAMRKLGLKVVIMTDPVDQHLGKYRFSDYWSRHVRWGRIRKSQAPHLFPTEILFRSMFSGVLGALAFHQAFAIPPYFFIFFHLLLWAICDWIVLHAMKFPLRPLAGLAWMLNEVLALPISVLVLSGNAVSWRGRRIKLKLGGVIDAKDGAGIR